MLSVDIRNNSQLLLWLASSADAFRVYKPENLRNTTFLEIFFPELCKQRDLGMNLLLICLSFLIVSSANVELVSFTGRLTSKLGYNNVLQTALTLTLTLQFRSAFWSESSDCFYWPGICSLCAMGLWTDETEVDNLLHECTKYGPTVTGHSCWSTYRWEAGSQCGLGTSSVFYHTAFNTPVLYQLSVTEFESSVLKSDSWIFECLF